MKSIIEKDHIVVVSAFYPPIPGGSSVIVKNLLKGLNTDSYTVYTNSPSFKNISEQKNVIFGMKALPNFPFKSRFEAYWQKIQYKSALRNLIKICRDTKATKIIGIYPDYLYLKLALEASAELNLPLISYLHDTISEGLAHTEYSRDALALQTNIFKESKYIFVMSEGMKNLYQKKYKINVDVLEHSYPEEQLGIDYNPAVPLDNFFWGGAIYKINKNSLSRVFNCATNLNINVEVAAELSLNYLAKSGFNTTNIKINNYSRKEYLKALSSKGILILSLDWTDESPVHEDELATIFPTKTIEYLNSGRPILVYCPQNYFLADFFIKNKCGYVVTSRESNLLEQGIKTLLTNHILNAEMVKNAIDTAQLFNHGRVQGKFLHVINNLD